MKNILIGIISLFFVFVLASCKKETSNYIKELKAIKEYSSNSVEADFSANVTTASSSENIRFTDNSAGDITSWFWDFGDGGTSYEKNPSHRYRNTNGSVTVKLTVSNSSDSDTETKTNYIYIY